MSLSNINPENRYTFGRRFLSELVALRTYAETKPDGRKETHDENVERVIAMHTNKFPHYTDEIRNAFNYVKNRMVLPSMRSMQFAGYAIERSNARGYNCAATNIASFRDIADVLWLSMNGCGVGFSVQKHHIRNLPVISHGNASERMMIEDTKEGWAESIKALLNNPKIKFDYSLIRTEGSKLSTGGTASGPKPLRDAHEHIRRILNGSAGRQLTSLEVHDIICHQADAVVVGGVRRAALISLFDHDDSDMMTAKSGKNFTNNPQRQRANNSAVLFRQDPKITDSIQDIMEECFRGGFGEPGIYISNNLDMVCNPCVEIALLDGQMCNLTEINAASCYDSAEFFHAASAAALIGTLQASYTNFHYIQPKWRQNCEKDALLGVSITGQAENWNLLSNPEVLREGARIMRETNLIWAKKLGINPAARIGCTKPSGSASTYLGTTAGIHGAYDEYFLRRMQIDRGSPLAMHLKDVFGERDPNSGHPVESHNLKENLIVVAAPHAAPNAIIAGRESAVDLLERAHHIRKNWIEPSHVYGDNYHNVSLTCYYRNSEQGQIIDWMKQHADAVSGVSFFPHGGVSGMAQTPYESISRENFHAWCEKFDGVELNLNEIDFRHAEDVREGEVACAGGLCETL